MSLRDAIEAAASGAEVPAAVLEAAFGTIMDGEATPAQIGALLMALRTKGETVAEIAAVAKAMRARAEMAPLVDPGTVDTCGTGGDAAGTFNISTTAAFVVAGAGVPVAKHGNRAASSKSGSADVLEALGVAVEISIEASARVLDAVGLSFFFARRAHPAMRHLGGVRAELGVRTLMNCMGPLLNPVGARRQLIGVYSRELVTPLARVLGELGSDAAWVVHGDDGLDEITTTTTTQGARLAAGAVETFTIDPAEYGIAPARVIDLAGGDAASNAQISLGVLGGDSGAPTDIVVLNAGAALVVAGRVPDLASGIGKARESISSGAALDRLKRLAEATQAEAAG